MNEIKNCGPAFPVVGQWYGDLLGGQLEHGMSLRDYFAAKAMPEIYQRAEGGGFDRVAKLSYEMADAMLKAREQKS